MLPAVCYVQECVPMPHGLQEPSCPTQARAGDVQTEVSETGWEECLLTSCNCTVIFLLILQDQVFKTILGV